MNATLNSQLLLDCVTTKMPFGKHAGQSISDLPEDYLLWFAKKEFPKGQIGLLMQLMLEIRINGLESLLLPIKKHHQHD